MAEETTPKAPAAAKEAKAVKPAKAKEPAIEEKPFTEFIEQHFIPALKEALAKQGIGDLALSFNQGSLPIVGNSSGQCWQVTGSWQNGQRQFSLYFLDGDINGKKAFSCTTNGAKPSVIESFMIDERKATLDLMVLYTLQRLNGQKWLARN